MILGFCRITLLLRWNGTLCVAGTELYSTEQYATDLKVTMTVNCPLSVSLLRQILLFCAAATKGFFGRFDGKMFADFSFFFLMTSLSHFSIAVTKFFFDFPEATIPHDALSRSSNSPKARVVISNDTFSRLFFQLIQSSEFLSGISASRSCLSSGVAQRVISSTTNLNLHLSSELREVLSSFLPSFNLCQ